MNCPKCHEKMKITDEFCPYCGFSFKDKKESSTNNSIESYSSNKRNDDCNYCKNDYLNNSYESWVNELIDNAVKSKKTAVLVLTVFIIFFACIFVFAGIASKQFVVIVPFTFMGAFFLIFVSVIKKSKPYAIKQYQGHTIFAYPFGKMMKVVIDNKQFEERFNAGTGNFKFQINNTNITFTVKYGIKEFDIIIDGE